MAEPAGAAAAGAERERGTRRTFGPVLLVGVTAAVVAVVAANRSWLGGLDDVAGRVTGRITGLGADGTAATTAVGESPLAAQLSLVLLAAWGVVLVARGRFRRAVAVLGAIAAAGVATAALLFVIDGENRRVDVVGAGADSVRADLGPWVWATLASALLCAAAFVLAWRWAPSWPEMGARYDAPTGAAGEAGDAARRPGDEPADRSSLDLWRAIDDGDDPTR